MSSSVLVVRTGFSHRVRRGVAVLTALSAAGTVESSSGISLGEIERREQRLMSPFQATSVTWQNIHKTV